MKHDFGPSKGLCTSHPERGERCERCEARLWFRVYWVRTSYEYEEGDYICTSCFRRETGQLSIFQRLADWWHGRHCRAGRHVWVDETDVAGGVICARCYEFKRKP